MLLLNVKRKHFILMIQSYFKDPLKIQLGNIKIYNHLLANFELLR